MPCAAMAMMIKLSIRSMLITFTLFTCLHLSVGQQIQTLWDYRFPVWHGESCGSSQYTNGSPFQLHLNQVLESLVVNVSTTGFATSTVEGQNSNDSVYGLLQCRGDLDSSFCQHCASTIKAALLENCQSRTSGFLQLEGCFLRYDDHSFYDYSLEDIQPYYGVECNNATTSPPDTFRLHLSEVLRNITERAVLSANLYAANVSVGNNSPWIYSLAQCWTDLSHASCNSCLSVALTNIETITAMSTFGCKPGSNGARFYAMGCHLRYETDPFFYVLTPSPPSGGPHTPIPTPPAGSSEVRKRNPLAITLGAVAASVGLIVGI